MITQSVSERRQQTNKLIQELLEERQAVWAEYGAIAAMRPFGPDQPLEIELRKFCQVMIDYVCLGHFGIYQRIAEGNERRRKVVEVAERIYPRVTEVTDAAVAFNDKYEALDGVSLRRSLADDLSRLGEELAARFELEDSLIQAMLD
ncbi:Rsd/AlgQ family anti-sigma factor [Methylococcus sp. EFPC2]|uniref:Rsd/AlgQ family anti-sigma factor n=1 Tax=Methylococcus sp. EFPC2 TaxID=2812648 RepID=UPI001967BF94|nr:Rsd/AlgQ family anti-sigma factor [Methylococcus sp. EFPC2]QSA96069.1 Rsd/AlgQ family anti-sigma factor [Methylococcus sp. EFPC2]